MGGGRRCLLKLVISSQLTCINTYKAMTTLQ